MFSIQSAPVVTAAAVSTTAAPTTTTVTEGPSLLLDDFGIPTQPVAGTTTTTNGAGDERSDTLLRPSSLALDTHYNLAKPHTGKIFDSNR